MIDGVYGMIVSREWWCLWNYGI